LAKKLTTLSCPGDETNKTLDVEELMPKHMPNLVCQYCKKPIYAAGGSEGYVHANSSAAECANPQVEGLKNRATPYYKDMSYVAYRAVLITEMTNTMFSYMEVRSPAELLEMLLADARHYADANGLAFDKHLRRSRQIYLQNGSDAPRTGQSYDASSTITDRQRTH
jgi:hypothetical protein